MINFNPWWKYYRIQVIFVTLILVIKPINFIFATFIAAFEIIGFFELVKRNLYEKTRPIDLNHMSSQIQDYKNRLLPENINQKIRYIVKDLNLGDTKVDGIMILDISNLEEISKYASLKVVQKEFSSKINPKFEKSIVSNFSKRRRVDYLNKVSLVSLNKPNKKLLSFFATYSHYLIEFFYICDDFDEQEININQYQKDVEEIYKYLFSQKTLATDKIDMVLNEVLQSAYKYLDGIIILNISDSVNSKYNNYFQVEKQVFKDKIVKVNEIIDKISNKKIWNRLDIVSKIYLEIIFSHLTTVEIWSFYLVDKGIQKYAIVFWTETSIEQFNTGQYHVIYQNKVREFSGNIRETILNLLKEKLI